MIALFHSRPGHLDPFCSCVVLVFALIAGSCGGDGDPVPSVDAADEAGDVADGDASLDDGSSPITDDVDVDRPDSGADAADVPADLDPDTAEDSGADSAETPVCVTAGTVCSEHDECCSAQCLPEPNGVTRCAVACETADDCRDGWSCVDRVSGFSTVAVCVAPWLCESCEVDGSCGGPRDRCIVLGGDTVCARACGGPSGCPDGWVCDAVETADGGGDDQCVPESGLCIGCLDEDEDGYGEGAECLDVDCDDADPDRNPGAEETCNRRDDDCDGEVDEDLVHEENPCGGCAPLSRGGAPATPCGTCDSGAWACTDDLASTECIGDLGGVLLNACGGCSELTETLGALCGTCDSGAWACDGADDLVCAGDFGDDAYNPCGGCTDLLGQPEEACGACLSGAWECDGLDAVMCEGDLGRDALNACLGCAELENEPGTPCGTCDSGTWVCDGHDAVTCDGDLGLDAYGDCGRCPPCE